MGDSTYMNLLKKYKWVILFSIIFLNQSVYASESSAPEEPKTEKKAVSEEEQPKTSLTIPVQSPAPAKKIVKKPVEPISYSPQKAMPESVTRVDLSNTQINRIIAPSGHSIKDVIIQKGSLQAKIDGRNAFVNFTKTLDAYTQETKSTSDPAEIYVVLETGTVYTLISNPKKISAQTVQLGGDDSKIKENLAMFDGMPLEKKAVLLTKTAISGEIPESFAQKKIGKRIDAISSLNLILNRIVTVEGENLILKEYYVSIKGEERATELNEKTFLLPSLTQKTIGITLENANLVKGQVIRLFIVERRG